LLLILLGTFYSRQEISYFGVGKQMSRVGKTPHEVAQIFKRELGRHDEIFKTFDGAQLPVFQKGGQKHEIRIQLLEPDQHSPVYQNYARTLARLLARKHDLNVKLENGIVFSYLQPNKK